MKNTLETNKTIRFKGERVKAVALDGFVAVGLFVLPVTVVVGMLIVVIVVVVLVGAAAVQLKVTAAKDDGHVRLKDGVVVKLASVIPKLSEPVFRRLIQNVGTLPKSLRHPTFAQ